jgi:hypothetical protein
MAKIATYQLSQQRNEECPISLNFRR